jgi:hypothetical protein
VACGQYVRQHLEPCGLDQSAEEEKTHYAMLRTVLSGHGAKSAMVHGLQRLFATGDGKRCDPFTITERIAVI